MKKLTTFVAVFLVTGCASMSEMKMDDSMDVQSMISGATASIKKAASAGGEWRDSGKFLKQAEAALKAGDTDKAMAMVKKAKAEGELGYAQAESQKDAGPWLF